MPSKKRQYLDLSRPQRAFTFTVEAKEEGVRLDTLLRAHYPWHSRTFYRRKIERGEVLVNEAGAKASARVRLGDHVLIQLPEDPTAPERECADDLTILFEDEDLVALDKPSGLSAHPVGRTRHGTLINKLHARYRSDDPKLDIVPRLSHRLDRDTSGVVLAVKNRRVDALIGELFTTRAVSKTYLAIVAGVPSEAGGWIEAPIAQDPEGDTSVHQAVVPGGQPARTRWRLRERYGRHALLELWPLTGRTHQLRVHLAHIGFPIVADHLYGDPRPLLRSHADPGLSSTENEVLLSRLALHASKLELEHPLTGQPLCLESPLPAEMVHATAVLAEMARTQVARTQVSVKRGSRLA